MAKKLTDYGQEQINGTAKSNTNYMRLHKIKQRIFHGDGVTLSSNVAKDYPKSGDGISSDKFIKTQGKMIKKIVRARDLTGAGDSLDEFGYNPTKYKPKNKK